MKHEFHITTMKVAHIREVHAIEQQSFSVPWSSDMIADELDNPVALYLVCLIGSAVAGYIGCHIVLNEGYITNIAVAPAFRRRGVSSALIDALTDHARKRRCAFLSLEVRESNKAARSLYERHGFIYAGRRKHYYDAPIEDALIMTCTLE